ncbi:MAG: hypothetical protein R2778_02840 [Saprospiraceae bacterium]
MVEASSGVNLWSEWARIEYAVASGKKYSLPKIRKDYSGIIVSLARQKDPDISQFNDPEIVWRMQNNEYVGLIVQSPKRERVIELLDDYAMRVQRDYRKRAAARDE